MHVHKCHENGLEAEDFDVAAAAHSDQVGGVFAARHTIPTGIAHGTVIALCNREHTSSAAREPSSKPDA